MVKEAWGKKHTCPKCETRFYDLGKKGPAVCIECEHSWVPEPILKTKQSHAAPAPAPAPKPDDEAAKTPATDETAADVTGGEADKDVAAAKGLEVEVEDDADEKSGVMGDVSLDDDKEDLSEVVDTKLAGGSE